MDRDTAFSVLVTATEAKEAATILRNAALALGAENQADALLAVLRSWRIRAVAPIDDFETPLDTVLLRR